MDRFAARRKLIRGSLSAPLVLTVASPAALPRQSFEACLYRASKAAQPSEVTPLIGGAEHDTWLRKSVFAYPGNLNTNSGKIQFTGSEGDRYWYEILGGSGPSAVYFPVDGNGCGPNDGNGGYLANNSPNQNKRISVQVLVHVRADGTPVGYGACPNGGFPVTTSCYASFGGMMQL